jgi:hypothetical protein
MAKRDRTAEQGHGVGEGVGMSGLAPVAHQLRRLGNLRSYTSGLCSIYY